MFGVAIDVSNAFNTVNRAFMIAQLLKYPNLHLLFPLVHWAYKSPSSLYFKSNNKLIMNELLKSWDGSKQGDALATLLFCIAIHSFLVDTKQKFPNIDIMAIADDIHILGSDKVELIEAYKYLKHELYDKATLKVNPQKCQFINLLQHSHPIDDDFI